MSRVLILSTTTGYQLQAVRDAGERLGIELFLATDRCHVLDDPWGDAAIPVRFHEEPASLAAVRRALRGRPVNGVLALGDRPAILAGRVSEALGVPGHPSEAARRAGNKKSTREALAAAGLPSPWVRAVAWATLDVQELGREVRYPAVVKPLVLSGSRGVMRVDDPGSLASAVERLRRLLAQRDILAQREEANDAFLVEGYIDGSEVAIEGVVDRGRFQALAIFDKPDPLCGPYFEETIYVTPTGMPARRAAAVVRAVEDGVRALGLWHGPIHAECRLNGEGVWILEIAARPIGGLCARALRFDRGGESMSLEELLLRQAAGESPAGAVREPCASGVMMIPIPRRGYLKRVDGLDRALAVEGVEDIQVTAKPDQLVAPLPEGASYLGFIFARGRTSAEVVGALRTAHERLAITIDAAPVLAGA